MTTNKKVEKENHNKKTGTLSSEISSEPFLIRYVVVP